MARARWRAGCYIARGRVLRGRWGQARASSQWRAVAVTRGARGGGGNVGAHRRGAGAQLSWREGSAKHVSHAAAPRLEPVPRWALQRRPASHPPPSARRKLLARAAAACSRHAAHGSGRVPTGSPGPPRTARAPARQGTAGQPAATRSAPASQPVGLSVPAAAVLADVSGGRVSLRGFSAANPAGLPPSGDAWPAPRPAELPRARGLARRSRPRQRQASAHHVLRDTFIPIQADEPASPARLAPTTRPGRRRPPTAEHRRRKRADRPMTTLCRAGWPEWPESPDTWWSLMRLYARGCMLEAAC